MFYAIKDFSYVRTRLVQFGSTKVTIMKNKTPFALLTLIFGLSLMTSLNASSSDNNGEIILTNFYPNSPELRWYIQDDNVMGGRSKGALEQQDGALTFFGNTNTNGGSPGPPSSLAVEGFGESDAAASSGSFAVSFWFRTNTPMNGSGISQDLVWVPTGATKKQS